MTDSENTFQIESDDENSQMKKVESSTSRSSTPTNSLKPKRARLTFPFGACRVCSDSATGIHYGIATCEGCKGFFKRSILRKEKYRCYFDNSCLVNVTNRNRCKACRFQRCIEKGMSVDGVKMGRIPKLVKERALLEQKEQQMRQEAGLSETNERSDEISARESSCSSLSDRSIENYDPNMMETDMVDVHGSVVRRNCQSSKMYPNNNVSVNHNSLYNDRIMNRPTVQSNPAENSHKTSSDNNQKQKSSLLYRTKYPTYLPDDFTLDETDGMQEHSTGILSQELFKHLQSISSKLSQNRLPLHVPLTDDELTFIKFLRWSSYNIHLRHSKRVKQLEARMNQMIIEGIDEYPGDNSTDAHFFATVPRTLEVIVRSSVFYIQELPGMVNMGSANLHKMILHRSFDWYMLKYSCLFHGNGQSYILSPDGFQYTRRWMHILYGTELTTAMFKFSYCLRQLNLTEAEFCLLIPFQMCHPDSTMENQDILHVLRTCYSYALHQELCQNRGTLEGNNVYNKILKVLDLLVPLNESYEKNVGSRVLQT